MIENGTEWKKKLKLGGDLKLLKVVWLANGTDLEWDLKFGKLEHIQDHSGDLNQGGHAVFVYFNRLSGTAHTQMLVEILFRSRFQPCCWF